MEAHGLTRERRKQPRQALEGQSAGEIGLAAATRRLADVILATALLLLFAPLLIAIAIAIRVDSPGSALFRQRRVGYRGREFTLFKFRSMCADADPERHREYVTALISGANADAEDGRQDLYKLTVDSRITSVGRWIRRWSLDELPQLLNVVTGDMSLVGPRPAIPYEVAKYPTWYMRRFDVKPGLTGFWQVNGRNERTYEEMVRLDIQYAERRSLKLDLTILAKTPLTVISRRGVS